LIVTNFNGIERDWLPQFDRLVKSFRYREAWDAVVSRKNIPLLIAAVRELVQRNGLAVALSGRTSHEIVHLTDILIKHIATPRFSSVLIDLAFSVLNIYGNQVSGSNQLMLSLKHLRKRLSSVIREYRRLQELKGVVELVTSISKTISQ
jgi:U3 small nucleolar RNA-associated protein 15